MHHPLALEEDDEAVFDVVEAERAASTADLVGVEVAFDPARMLIRQAVKRDIDVVLGLEAVLDDIEL